MIAPPLVSLVIPAYNAAGYIRETLDSVLAQTHRPLEIIVVDDGSVDGTREIVQSYGERVRYFWQPNSGGCSSPRNRGLREAAGQFVAFLDADDLILPTRIEAAVAVMRRRPDVGLTFTNFVHFDANGVDPADHFSTCTLLREHLDGRRTLADPLVLPSAICTDILLVENFGSSAPMVRRDAAVAVGGFDESLPANEDFEFNYRVAMTAATAVIPDVLMQKRRHATNMTSYTDRMLHAQILVRRKMMARTNDRRVRRALRQALRTFHLGLAYYYTGRDNRRALGCAMSSLRFSPVPSLRHFARIAADLAGRDTNAEARRLV